MAIVTALYDLVKALSAARRNKHSGFHSNGVIMVGQWMKPFLLLCWIVFSLMCTFALSQADGLHPEEIDVIDLINQESFTIQSHILQNPFFI